MTLSAYSPAHEATSVAVLSTLAWADSVASDYYKVYFSATSADVTNKATAAYRGNVTVKAYDPRVTLGYGTVYYWQIVAVKAGSADVESGVKSFTTVAEASLPSVSNRTKRVCFAANNKFWYTNTETPPRIIELADLVLATNSPISMVECQQKVFIANDSILKVVDFMNTKLTVVAMAAYPTRGSTLVQAGSNATMIVDFVDSTKVYIYGRVISGTFRKDMVTLTVSAMATGPTIGATISQATSGATAVVLSVNTAKTEIVAYDKTGTFDTTNAVTGGSMTSSIPSGVAYPTVTGGGMTAKNPTAVTEPAVPHYYTWTAYAGDATFYGTIVARAAILKLYRNRLFLSGNPADPHQWYLSRQDNPYDFLYAADDEQSPVAGQDSKAGKIGDIVLDVIPYEDDYCLIAAVGSLWLMRGDPASGGSLDVLAGTVGLISKDAWCIDSNKNLYVLSPTGLYKIPYPLGLPQPLTDEDVIPTFTEDLNLNAKKQRITLAYDATRKGIQICVTDIQLGTNSNYWYDLVTKGFFPETYPDNDSVYSQHFYNADEPEFRKLLVGCKDGHVRIFDDNAKSDDKGSLTTPLSEAIVSFVLLGPVLIGESYERFSILNSLMFTTAGGGIDGSIPDSDDITWKLFVDATAEGVIEKCDAGTAPFSGTVTAPGRAFRKRPRAKGVFAGVYIGNSIAGQTWGIERVSGDLLKFGEVR
jgi:hypothetical protein